MVWITYGGDGLPGLDAALRALGSAAEHVEAVSVRAALLDAETAWASPAAAAFRSAFDLWRRRLVAARPVLTALDEELSHARAQRQAGGMGAP